MEAGDRGQPVPGIVCSSGVVQILGPCLCSWNSLLPESSFRSSSVLALSVLEVIARGCHRGGTKVSVTGHRAAVASVTQARCHRTLCGLAPL